MKNIKIGIASFAHMHAFSYYNCLKQIKGAEISAIAEENKYALKKIKEFPQNLYKSYEKLALDKNLDVILVTTENSNHKKVAILALENGKDVIVEKPIATNLNDADEMIKCAEKNNQKLIQCYPCRYHPTSISIKNLIENGELGELLGISATNHGRMPPHEGSDKWFSQKELSGGGALMDHITHIADLNFWFSKQELNSVFAMKSNYFHPEIDIDDAGMVFLTYKKGLKGTIDPSWSRPSNFETWGDVTMTIFGTEQTLTMDMFNQFARMQSNKLTHPVQINYGSNMDLMMLNDFIEKIRNDEMPILSGIDGKNALEVAILAYQSAESGEIKFKQ